MSSITISSINSPNGLRVSPPSSQFVSINATANSSSGGSLTFAIPSASPWLLNAGNNTSIQLATGQYYVSIYGINPLSSSNSSPDGSYGDIGFSQNNVELSYQRYNFGGFGGSYNARMTTSTAFTSDGTSATSITGLAAVGGGTSFNSSSQNYVVRILKVG